MPVAVGYKLGTEVLAAVRRARVTGFFLEFLPNDQTSMKHTNQQEEAVKVTCSLCAQHAGQVGARGGLG